MANTEKFDSITELYKRLLPALHTKIDEMQKMNIINIKDIDLWDYCVNNCWKDKENLRLYEMVNDILKVDPLELQLFVRNRGNNER
jgi:hypothetical protein